jgi:hypothetical protein
MRFSEALELLKDGKYTNVQVTDSDGKRLLDCEGLTSETLILKLEQFKPQLSSYGRVRFKVATEAIKRANWKDAYVWDVNFIGDYSGVSSNNELKPFSPGIGFISQNEATLMSQLEGLKKEMEFNKRFDELNKKLEDKKSFNVKEFLPLAPMLSLFFDIKPDKMLQFSQMAGAMNATQNTTHTGIAGLIPTDKKTTVKGTPEEQALILSINDNLEKLSEKVSVEKIEEFIRTLNDKPEFLTMLLNMASSYK